MKMITRINLSIAIFFSLFLINTSFAQEGPSSRLEIEEIIVTGQTAIAGKGDDLLSNPDVGRLFLGG